MLELMGLPTYMTSMKMLKGFSVKEQIMLDMQAFHRPIVQETPFQSTSRHIF
jgi:hypothetical protein